MCEALPIVMPGFLERFPTTAKDTSDETEKLAKATANSHSSLILESLDLKWVRSRGQACLI